MMRKADNSDAAKSDQPPTLAERFAGAKTAADFRVIVDQIESDLRSATERLAKLENRREAVIVGGAV
jgi:hypothetical protein